MNQHRIAELLTRGGMLAHDDSIKSRSPERFNVIRDPGVEPLRVDVADISLFRSDRLAGDDRRARAWGAQ